MTKDLLIKTGRALYGERWQTDLSKDINLSSPRRIRQWLADERPIPDGIENDLAGLLLERLDEIKGVLKDL